MKDKRQNVLNRGTNEVKYYLKKEKITFKCARIFGKLVFEFKIYVRTRNDMILGLVLIYRVDCNF